MRGTYPPPVSLPPLSKGVGVSTAGVDLKWLPYSIYKHFIISMLCVRSEKDNINEITTEKWSNIKKAIFCW